MSTLYHILRADFYERSRRYSFLITLGLVVWLGYLCANGTIVVRLNGYRGEFNSAWVGSMMALVTNVFLGLFGFYLIKNAIERDRQTGVGQIIATTSITKPAYLFGKWLSNLVVYGVMVAIMAVATLIIQLVSGESTGVDLGALYAPLIFFTMPSLAVIAAFAIVFECVPFLRGTLGNIIYFFLWTFITILSINLIGELNPAFDINGISFFMHDMGAVLRQTHPDYVEGFSIGITLPEDEPLTVFLWPGLNWTFALIAARLSIVAIAAGIVGLATLVFDRFADTGGGLFGRVKRSVSEVLTAPSARPAAPAPQHIHLSPIVLRYNFFAVVWAEMRLMLKGRRWWWYVLAALFIFLPLTADKTVLPAIAACVYLWPIALWSALGAREAQHHTHQLVFAIAKPLSRQLVAQWLASVLVTLLLTSGFGVYFAQTGATASLFTWSMGVLFIPSLALATGIWSGSSKLFEVLYILLWYIGPVQQTAALDYVAGPTSTGIVLAGATGALLVAAVVGRRRAVMGN